MKNLFYSLVTLMVGLSSYAQCITNGDFESGITTNYTFRINPDTNKFEVTNCNVNTSAYPTFLMPNLVNQFTNLGGTLVDDTSTENYGPYDQSLFNSGINIYRVSPVTGGSKALKLNNSSGSADITAMSVDIASAPQNIMFDYSIIIENPHPDKPTVQPFFSARLYDVATGNIIYNGFCLTADENNAMFSKVETSTDIDILYTDWQCGSLPVPSAYIGKNIRLELVIADCGEGGHFGTVYLDNIRCGTTCNIFGKIALDKIKKSCPEEPFNVCGSFINPANSTIINNTIKLSIIDGNGIVTQLSLSPFISGNTFCFTVSPTEFGTNPSGEYKFRVAANFQTPIGIKQLSGVSLTTGPNVMFGVLSPSLNSSVIDNYIVWDDVDEIYTLEFVSDNLCCPHSSLVGSPPPQAYTTLTVTDNFIPVGAALVEATRCFRWRIKTSCGWSDWCCLSDSYPSSGKFNNYLAPNCYNGDLCIDTITILNLPENIIQSKRLVDREISIKAHNIIKNGALTVYRAGNFVELSPSFMAESGSVFTALIEPCTGADNSGVGLPTHIMRSEYDNSDNNTVNDVSTKRLVLYPNPANDYINLSVENQVLKQVTVISLDGNTMFNGSINTKAQLDISKYKKGFYFVTVTTENGDTYTEKLMVN